jgi:hypothetical protein
MPGCTWPRRVAKTPALKIQKVVCSDHESWSVGVGAKVSCSSCCLAKCRSPDTVEIFFSVAKPLDMQLTDACHHVRMEVAVAVQKTVHYVNGDTACS